MNFEKKEACVREVKVDYISKIPFRRRPQAFATSPKPKSPKEKPAKTTYYITYYLFQSGCSQPHQKIC